MKKEAILGAGGLRQQYEMQKEIYLSLKKDARYQLAMYQADY